MSDHAAIAAQVVDIQNDRMHKGFIKVTIHVPAECGQQLTAAMGWPTYTTPVPVAIARLNPETEVMPDTKRDNVSKRTDTPSASGPDIQARARKRGYAQIAGIICNDPLFHRYLENRLNVKSGSYDAVRAAEYVRHFCKVTSRSLILPDTEAATRFDLLQSAFVCWRDASYVEEPADA